MTVAAGRVLQTQFHHVLFRSHTACHINASVICKMLVFCSKVKRCQRVPATMFRQEELLRQAVSTPVPRSTRDVWAVSTFQKLGGILHHKAEHHHHFGSYEFYRPPIRLKNSEAVGAHWSYALDTACPRPTNPSCKIGCYASSISRSTRSLAYSIPCLLASAPHDISQSQTDLYRSILISKRSTTFSTHHHAGVA